MAFTWAEFSVGCAQTYEHKFENRTLFYRFHLDAVGPAPPEGAGPSTSWCDALCESLCVPRRAPVIFSSARHPHGPVSC